jgi:hypothetical protein
VRYSKKVVSDFKTNFVLFGISGTRWKKTFCGYSKKLIMNFLQTSYELLMNFL